MLKSLTSDVRVDARFAPGLNVAVARPSAGKTGFVRLLDFMLGADVRYGHPLRKAELATARFTLTLDLRGAPHTLSRSTQALPEIDGEPLRLTMFRARLGKALFGLTGGGTEPSFRSLIAYYLRDAAAGGFASPTETYRKQRSLDTQPSLAYLFGLDVDLVAKVREVSETDRNLRELRKAAKDSILTLTVGHGRDLDAQIGIVQIQRDTLATQLADFEVAESYARHRAQADELSRLIREANDRLVLAERGLKDIEAALSEEEPFDHDYVRLAYEEAGAALPELVARRFDEVETFHRSIVANRRRYLSAERTRLMREQAAELQNLTALDGERAQLMRLLQAEGALETFSELHRRLSVLDGRLSELIERRAVVERWSDTSRQVHLRSAELDFQVSADLDDRRDHLATVSNRFAAYAYSLYGDRRPAALAVEPRPTGYRFVPTIAGPRTHESHALTIFCFDLALAVTALRGGHGPDFLVHDSHLFESVPDPLLSRALGLAADICAEENLQYVTALDADRLPSHALHTCIDLTQNPLFGFSY